MSVIIDEDTRKLGIQIRKHKATVNLYPIDMKVVEQGAKVVTRTGRTVRNIRLEPDGRISGVLDDVRSFWDLAGRWSGPYEDHENDLYIPERYFDPNWRQYRNMTNAEWNKKFGANDKKEE